MAVTVAPAAPHSTLNPNAPLFVPAAYLATEDYSPEWWNLIQTPAFKDYWLRERCPVVNEEEEEDEEIAFDLEDLNVADEFDELNVLNELDWETDDVVLGWTEVQPFEQVNKAQSLVTSAIMALADREAKLTIEREGYRSAAVQCNVFKEKVKRPGKVKSDKIQQPRHEVRAPMKRL